MSQYRIKTSYPNVSLRMFLALIDRWELYCSKRVFVSCQFLKMFFSKGHCPEINGHSFTSACVLMGNLIHAVY